LGLLTEIDRAALAAYCVAWGRWVDAEQNLQKYGTVIKSPDKGWLVQSPYLSIANRAMDQMAKMLTEFGMSPSSRSRVHGVKATDLDPFEEFLRDGRNSG
jgi:P27 family predicted phage terminase small subunit